MGGSGGGVGAGHLGWGLLMGWGRGMGGVKGGGKVRGRVRRQRGRF